VRLIITVWNAWPVLTGDMVYVGLLGIAILGFLLSLVPDAIERMLVPWKTSV
jgi:NitT/TauT family transport system permease protein